MEYRALVAALVAGLGALTGVAAQASGPTPPANLPCPDWPVSLGYTTLNALGPETSANYWVTSYGGVRGTGLVIRGAYPAARFFSFAVQDSAQTTLGTLRDDRITPDPGLRNPFQDPKAARDRAGRNTYRVDVDFASAPARPVKNTLYTGRTLDGEPNAAGTMIYRLYVPTDQHDRTGGVGLPSVALRTPTGEIPLTLRPCGALPPDDDGPANRQVNGQSQPDAMPRIPSSNRAYADPNFIRIFAGQFYTPVVNALPPALAAYAPRRKGVPLANGDFPYVFSQISRYHGAVVAVRFHAPSFPDTLHGAPLLGPYQTRFWSVCTQSDQNGGIRTWGCVQDWLARPGSDGYVRLLVTDQAHRPATVTPGITWLNWGPTSEDQVLYRLGVPSPHWRESPDRIDRRAADQVAAARRGMGSYYPLARYCTAPVRDVASFDECIATGYGSAR